MKIRDAEECGYSCRTFLMRVDTIIRNTFRGRPAGERLFCKARELFASPFASPFASAGNGGVTSMFNRTRQGATRVPFFVKPSIFYHLPS